MHVDIVLSLRVNADLTSPGPPVFVRDGNINQGDSDYESNDGLEIPDCRVASSKIDDDMQNDSDVEVVFHPPVRGCPSSQGTILVLEEHSVILLAIQSCIGPYQMTPGTLSRPKTTLICQAGSSGAS